ncbi:hypothetical protein [Paraburkholderia dilworthii]|uniref:hypothetical protein n=1 Tax=Paraburkholderia dilworthii TaxID=948106 RepID=UPI001FCAC23D|nr:hypothetical protein [Paraburkholderia dilworthii]
MPQSPIKSNVALSAANKSSPLQMDQSGNLLIGNGSTNKLNITAITAVKASAGRVCKVTVVAVATAGNFAVYDVATTGAAATANAIIKYTASWPAVGTVIPLDFPCLAGIVVDPGTGGQVAVSFD